MKRYIVSASKEETYPLLSLPHSLIAIPNRCASINAGDEIHIYQKKIRSSGGAVIGGCRVNSVIHAELNEPGRIGPPREILRYWATHVSHTPQIIAGLDELADFELPDYYPGVALNWIWSSALIHYIKQTGEWPSIEKISQITGLPNYQCYQEQNNILKEIKRCENWLEQCGIVTQFGSYTNGSILAATSPLPSFQSKTLLAYKLHVAPRKMCAVPT